MNPHIIKHFSFTTWLRRRWPVVVAVAGALAIVTLLLWGYFETRTALDLTGNTEAPEVGEEALPSDPPSGGDERARDKLPREPGDELSNDGSPTSPLLRDSARPSALAPLTGGSTPAPVSSPPSASPRPTLSAPTPEPPEVPPTLAPESAAKVEVEEEIELDAIAQPPPLLLEVEGEIDTEVSLSNSGILAETNSERARLGLSPLRISSNLNAAATLKVIDMFARQYFEHTSPTGVTISDLSESVGYDYILVGENLALGNFSSDAALVAAWMGSPGHRANILHDLYHEIGVAALQGEFEGDLVWLAVQEFGVPRTACTTADTALKTEIETAQVTLAKWRLELDTFELAIETAKAEGETEEYNAMVREFNDLVSPYNDLATLTRSKVESYNAQVESVNACLASFK